MTIEKLVNKLESVKDSLNTNTGTHEEWLNSYALNKIIDDITKLQWKIQTEGIDE